MAFGEHIRALVVAPGKTGLRRIVFDKDQVRNRHKARASPGLHEAVYLAPAIEGDRVAVGLQHPEILGKGGLEPAAVVVLAIVRPSREA